MKKKLFGAVTAAVLVAGAMFTSAALAENAPATTTTATTQTEKSAKHTEWISQLSEGAQATYKQLSELRQAAHDKLKADSQAVVDQAVKDGKITQEEGQSLLARGGKHGGGRHGGKGGGFGRGFHGRTLEEMKADLDSHVKEGKMTQEQADKLLEQWKQHQAQAESRTK